MQTTGILILDFGSPYTLMLARRLRDLGVFCEVHPYDTRPEDCPSLAVRGVILSGGEREPVGAPAPRPTREVLELGVPVLGIGYGMQVLAARYRGDLRPVQGGEPRLATVQILRQSPLFAALASQGPFSGWLARVATLDWPPKGFVVTANSDDGHAVAMEHLQRRIFAVQFHPEAGETENGYAILANFAHNLCGLRGDWDLDRYLRARCLEIRDLTAGARVLCPMTQGGRAVVTAALLHEAIGERLVPLLIETGREGDDTREQVEAMLATREDLSLEVLDGRRALKGLRREDEGLAEQATMELVIDFARRRKIPFVGLPTSLSQRMRAATGGAVAPSLVEPEPGKRGAPRILEPLRELFSEEVREIGLIMGLP
jgi:GMP synthase (glutamine-hydrolysing)